MAKNVELTARQKRMIAAMLTSKNIGVACESVGVSRTTLARWLTTDAFNNALKKAQSEAITHSGCQLIAAQEKSIQALLEIVETAKNENAKRASANDLLHLSLKFVDQFNIEARIAALEEKILNK